MKTAKKHRFTHPDPEKITEKAPSQKEAKITKETVPASLQSDMKRTLILVGLFSLFLTLIFFIQEWTGQPKEFIFGLLKK